MNKGKLIVMEGACDGIGKTTQYNLLKEMFKQKNIEVVTHHFPSYGTDEGKLVENYLRGIYGKPEDLSPYFVNGLYAADRGARWNDTLKKPYENGNVILLDRYTTSSLIYQSALIESEKDKNEFIKYVKDYEYNKIGIKEPDQVLFLYAPFDVITKTRNARKSNEGVENDIHESNLDFMMKVYDNACFLAEKEQWDIIDCCRFGELDSVENIHQKVYSKIKK